MNVIDASRIRHVTSVFPGKKVSTYLISSRLSRASLTAIMVSTRSHKTEFPPLDLSPSKALTRTSRRRGKWHHTPDPTVLLWLMISLPLVAWDAAYVFGRPYTMPDGWLHSPIWTPYALYGEVDYIYGWKAWNEHNGFTAAQTALNVIESIGYIAYLWVVWRFGEGEKRVLPNAWGGVACLVGFGLCVMTVSKTALYCEYCSSGVVIGGGEWWGDGKRVWGRRIRP